MVSLFERFQDRKNFMVIAGPCAIESEEHTLFMAQELKSLADENGFGLVFKSSFDKANRSSIESFRGPGIEEGLRILARVREEVGVPVISDIHTPDQAEPAGKVLDIIQVPAFLCRQTDLLVAAAKTGRPVSVKKGQFVSPADMKNVVNKLRSAGCTEVMLTERGASFGYNNLVVDMRGIAIMRDLGCPVIMDATHSVQLPGGQGTSSGGQREFVPVLARAAVAAGADAVFLEVHDNPDKAPCDGPNMLPLSDVVPLVEKLKKIKSLV